MAARGVVLAMLACACGARTVPPRPPAPVPPVSAPTPSTTSVDPTPSVPADQATAQPLVLLAAGDVEMARAMGFRLLREPTHDPFVTVAPLLARADVRFANLEGPLSEQHGETMSRTNMLVFNGPPAGADALARGGFTVVSTANNHAWDYGARGLSETLDNLERVGVLHAGTGRTRDEARRPAIVEQRGVRVAFLAVTDVWNFGPLAAHPAADHVAGADPAELARAVAALRADRSLDAIVVSYHGGDEYADVPLARARAVAHAAIDAGASAFIGHHPHVVQGVEWYAGRPVFYSVGNLLMQMHRDHAWTEFGIFARLTIAHGGEVVRAEACPFRIVGLVPRLLAGEPGRSALEGYFFGHWRAISASAGKARIGPPAEDGCAAVDPA